MCCGGGVRQADGRRFFCFFFYFFFRFFFFVIHTNAQILGIGLRVVGARGAPSALRFLLVYVAFTDIARLYMRPETVDGIRRRLVFFLFFFIFSRSVCFFAFVVLFARFSPRSCLFVNTNALTCAANTNCECRQKDETAALLLLFFICFFLIYTRFLPYVVFANAYMAHRARSDVSCFYHLAKCRVVLHAP
jgi:hypothetical protein